MPACVRRRRLRRRLSRWWSAAAFAACAFASSAEGPGDLGTIALVPARQEVGQEVGQGASQRTQGVHIDSAAVARAVRHLRERGDGEAVTVRFQLADGGLARCQLRESAALLPKATSERVPTAFALEGTCSSSGGSGGGGVRSVAITGIADRAGAINVALFDARGAAHDVFLDAPRHASGRGVANADHYVVSSRRHLSSSSSSSSSSSTSSPSSRDWSCAVDHHAAHAQDDEEEEERRGAGGGAGGIASEEHGELVVLTLAVSTTLEFSAYHGGTLESVLQAVLALVARVNGVFLREAGIMFRLAADSWRLVCLEDASTACDALGNDVLQTAGNHSHFLAQRGVPATSVDLAHALGTFPSGRATIGGACSSTLSRAEGATGQRDPEGGAFAVDYLAHELAHQLGATHTMSECTRFPGAVAAATAVEPGSGSTIMGYAGVCGASNLQWRSSPYFHAVSLAQMRAKTRTCGQVMPAPGAAAAPGVRALATRCEVPAGAGFGLEGALDPATAFGSWDRVDNASAAAAGPRVRSWAPRRGAARRYVPALFLAAQGLAPDPGERLAEASAELAMRLVARVAFDAEASAAPASAAPLVGGWAAAGDVRVAVRADVPAFGLEVSVIEDDRVRLRWDERTKEIAPRVRVLLARNAAVEAVWTRFDYATHELDPDWSVLVEMDNTGEAELRLRLPGEREREPGVGVPALLMLRSAREGCFFFDLATNLVLSDDQSLAGGQGEGTDGSSSTVVAPPGVAASHEDLGLPIAAATLAGVLLVAVTLVHVTASRKRRRQHQVHGGDVDGKHDWPGAGADEPQESLAELGIAAIRLPSGEPPVPPVRVEAERLPMPRRVASAAEAMEAVRRRTAEAAAMAALTPPERRQREKQQLEKQQLEKQQLEKQQLEKQQLEKQQYKGSGGGGGGGDGRRRPPPLPPRRNKRAGTNAAAVAASATGGGAGSPANQSKPPADQLE